MMTRPEGRPAHVDAAFALFTRRKQRAFDLVARTLVVRTP